MQPLLPNRLAKSVNPVASSVTKLFRTLFVASGLLIVFSMQAHDSDPFWIQIVDQEEYAISISYNSCDFPVLRIENKTSNPISLSWKEEVIDYLTNTAVALNSDADQKSTINANQVLTGSCASESLKVDLTGFNGKLEVGAVEVKLTNIKLNQ